MGKDRRDNRGSPYRKPKKAGRSSAFLRFLLFMVVLFFIGFFIFYAIDNNLFARRQEGIPAVSASDLEAPKTTEAVPERLETADEEKEEPFYSKLLSAVRQRLTGEDADEAAYPKNIRMDFYFATLGQEQLLGAEERTIAAGSPQTAAISAVNELLKGPYSTFYFAVIPPGTTLLDVQMHENFIRVNLSQEFLSNSLDSRILDGLIIYSIVNTLTQIPQVDGVMFLIEGKTIKEYGNVDLTLPLIRDDSFIDSG